nr:MAG TPA: Portal [Caudoviricetes sp.]
MNIFTKLFKSRDKPTNYLGGLSFLFGQTAAGKPVNEKSAMQVTAVYACVRILAESIAGLPLHVYRYNSGGGKEMVTDHNLYRILHDEPNPDMTSFIFRETLMSHLLLWGNAYAQIIRDHAGRMIGLYPLLPDKVEVDRDSSTGEIFYTYTKSTDENPNFKQGGQIRLNKNAVLHIPGLGFDGLVGYSPIAMAKNAVGIALATEEYGATFFANGATPGGILEHPGVVKDPERLRQSWQSQFGQKNSHRVAVLEEGMTFHQMTIPPEEAQFLETRKFQIDEIARIFRVPPHMVGDLEKSSFSNIEQQSLEFVKYTLNPWVIRWEQALQKALLTDKEKGEYFVKFNVDGLLRGDYQSRMNGYAIGRQNGWFSANDIREMENLNPIPDEEGGNLYLINGNMTKLKDAGLFAGQQKGKENEEKVLELGAK